ncbi:MAG TPA: flagellin [Terriglobales bacterium]|jgi:flagellin|nr:flagellin [Terriglobales bacterium]
MAISILNNIPSLAAQNQLVVTQANLQKTLEQLSSGSRINTGADDAAGLAIADGLQANVTALTQSALNATEGVGKLQVADGALSQVTTLLNRAVTLATESANGTVNDGSQRQALDAEFSAIKAEIDRIGTNTTYNGSQIFTGGQTNVNQVKTSVTNPAGLASGITGDMKIKYWDTTLAVPAYTTVTYGAATGDTTVGDLIKDINSSGKGLIATLDDTGNVVVTDTQNRGSATNPLADAVSTIKINGDGAADLLANTTNSSTMDVYLSDSTTAGSSKISVTLGTFDSANMNGISIANDNLQTAGGAQAALTDINNAISQVAALRGGIGAGINRLQAATNVMNNQTQNLSSAEDGIRAADITQTVASLTKYQILSQTGISALAQANQMPQSVLKLLQ